jgi:hypothetical protein
MRTLQELTQSEWDELCADPECGHKRGEHEHYNVDPRTWCFEQGCPCMKYVAPEPVSETVETRCAQCSHVLTEHAWSSCAHPSFTCRCSGFTIPKEEL